MLGANSGLPSVEGIAALRIGSHKPFKAGRVGGGRADAAAHVAAADPLGGRRHAEDGATFGSRIADHCADCVRAVIAVVAGDLGVRAAADKR